MTRISSVVLTSGAATTLTVAAAGKFNLIWSIVWIIPAALAFVSLDWLSRKPIPSPHAMEESVKRLRHQYESYVEHHAAEVQGIGPPVAVGPVPTTLQRQIDLDTALATAETMADRLFFARFFESAGRFTFLLGEPGSGKSVLLFRLAARMAKDHLEGSTTSVPLVFQLRDWTSDYPMRRWISEQACYRYAISPSVTRHWLDRGSSVLFLDGFDEVAVGQRGNLISELNSWSRSAGGTQLVVSCRSSQPDLPHVISNLHVDQLAVLRPFPQQQAVDYLEAALDRLKHQSGGALARSEHLDRLDRLLRGLITDESAVRLPLMLGLMAASESEINRGSEDHRPSEPLAIMNVDPAEPVFTLGNDLFAMGDYDAARGAYLAASRIPGSHKRALATLLYGVCEAVVGNEIEARRAMHESIAARLEESITQSDVNNRVRVVDMDEREVLHVMLRGVSYNLSQVCSRSGLPPSRADAALRSLRNIGAIETPSDDWNNIRFRRSETFAAETG
ncbi:NACHT domain-containing protein [Nocardia nepalensis]|uniref:NACHT domain-containing protein n=1 Tax=Nocardia nepalensis TaxID=3375448 RepID=UPI003B6830BB